MNVSCEEWKKKERKKPTEVVQQEIRPPHA